MEMINDIQRDSVVNELTQGKNLANELKRKLQPQHISSSRETCSFLLEKILTNYDNALSLLHRVSLLGHGDPSQPISRNQSSNKKRKITAKKKDEVRVCSWNGVEGQTSDGYNWRKYGQKDILGDNHPRAYYRCTHRFTQGCLATKKVQQTDKDPSIFEVVYKGKHSCLEQTWKHKKEEAAAIPPIQVNEEEILLPLTDDSCSQGDKTTFFSFAHANHKNEEAANIFKGSCGFMGTTCSTPFLLSPETPESCFCMTNNFQVNDMGIGSGIFGMDSEFNEIISYTTSFADFQLVDSNFDDFGSPFFDASDCLYSPHM